VGVASDAVEMARNLEHSIASAALPNIVLAGACPAEETALRRLVRRVESSCAPARRPSGFRQVADPAVQVMIDDRALDQRAIEMLAVLLVRQNGAGTATKPPNVQTRLSSRRSDRRQQSQSARRAAARTK
jgi:hypothetical protein